MINSVLTSFGIKLAKASELRLPSFDSSTKSWPNNYQDNILFINQAKEMFANKSKVLITGAGYEKNFLSYVSQTNGWIRSGVHWTNFIEGFPIDIMGSAHISPLEASMHSVNRPKILVHGVYSKVPPCLCNSFVMRWSDPYLSKQFNGVPSTQDIIQLISEKSLGVAPYLPIVRNSIFFLSTIFLWLGAKELVFTGVDPLNPQYFFKDNLSVKIEIGKSLSMCNPWLGEWDGRNERIPAIKRSTSHNIQHFINSILQSTSAVGGDDYIFEFHRGFKLIKNLADFMNARLYYVGNSSFMKETGLKRVG